MSKRVGFLEAGACALLLVIAGCEAGSGSTSRSQMEAACAVLRACGGGTGGAFGRCVGLPGLALTSRLACLARANGNCDAVVACEGGSVSLGGCPEYSRTCEGNAIRYCQPAEGGLREHATVYPCPAGTTCVMSEFGQAGCNPDCMGDVCQGDDVLRCDGITVRLEECPAGTACGLGPDMRAQCQPTGAPCTASRCDGDRLVYCGAVGREYPPIDCARWDLQCGSGSFELTCVTDMTECDIEEDADRCESGDLVYCGEDDRWHRFDCAAHGFRGCSVDFGQPYCVPTGSVVGG